MTNEYITMNMRNLQKAVKIADTKLSDTLSNAIYEKYVGICQTEALKERVKQVENFYNIEKCKTFESLHI